MPSYMNKSDLYSYNLFAFLGAGKPYWYNTTFLLMQLYLH